MVTTIQESCRALAPRTIPWTKVDLATSTTTAPGSHGESPRVSRTNWRWRNARHHSVFRGAAPRIGSTAGPGALAEDWDLTWTSRVTGKYRAIFDVPEIDSGYGVWRASIWAKQYAEVLKAAPGDCSAVLVLRHHGIAFACSLAFDDMIAFVRKKDGGTPDSARKTALAGLLPGVVLQPSGVFAALHAQDVGCKYLRAS